MTVVGGGFFPLVPCVFSWVSVEVCGVRIPFQSISSGPRRPRRLRRPAVRLSRRLAAEDLAQVSVEDLAQVSVAPVRVTGVTERVQ